VAERLSFLNENGRKLTSS